MWTKYGRTLALSAILLSITSACSNSSEKGALSREKALAILKKNADAILRPDRWRFGNIIFEAAADYPIPTSTSDIMAFCDNLVAAGLLKRETNLDKTVPMLGRDYRVYFYGTGEQPDVVIVDKGRDILVVHFVVDTLSFVKVTGIRMNQDNTATVTVDIQKSPNATFGKLSNAYVKTSMELHKPLQLQFPLPTMDFVNGQTTGEYIFTKYDDGWRLGR